MMIYAFSAVIIALCGMVFFMYRNGKKHGKIEVEKESAEELIDDIHTVKTAHDFLARNRSMRDKLRNKYTRT